MKMFPGFVLILMFGLIVGCSTESGELKILDISLNPGNIVAPNTDVILTADVEGNPVSYRWTTTGGRLRESAKAGQGAGFPKIGVSAGDQDAIEKSLQKYEIPYSTIERSVFKNSSLLESYDTIFINSDTSISVSIDDLILKNWVKNGGSVYMSGRAGEYFDYFWNDEITFPEPNPYIGSANESGEFLLGKLIDYSSKLSLGDSEIQFRFHDDEWPPILKVGALSQTLLTTDISGMSGAPPIKKLPVAVQLQHEKGYALFTSFYCKDDKTASEQILADYFAAKVITYPLVRTSKQLIDIGGWFLLADIIGIIKKTDYKEFEIEYDTNDDIFLSLNAYDGKFTVTADGPENRSETYNGSAPFTMAIPNALKGKWKFRVTCTDDGTYKNIPWALTIGTRNPTTELITTSPKATWRSPFDSGTWLVTLRVTDSNNNIDEMTVGIKVE